MPTLRGADAMTVLERSDASDRGESPSARASGRTSLRFSWEAVDSDLIRLMLAAVYDAREQYDDADRVQNLDGTLLVANATRVLGRPLLVEHMDVLVDVLCDHWLPTLSAPELAAIVDAIQLGLTGQVRTLFLSNKRQRLDFLGQRRRTKNFKAQIRKYFVFLHRLQTPITGGGSTVRVPRNLEAIELVGAGRPDHRKPFPHQRETWARLDQLVAAPAPRAGLVVLPTGSGKTYTLVRWLVRQLAADRDLRVLWLADRQELVDQAARTFEELAVAMPPGATRRMRVVHGLANLPSSIADPKLDVAIVTRQSVLSSLHGMGRKRLTALLSRPTIVVIDEAHHAVAPTYEHLLDLLSQADDVMFVGMTATPWPSGYGATQRLRMRFPITLADVPMGNLVNSGVLARPTFHQIATNETVELTPEELRQVAGRDLPQSVLRRLDRMSRNDTIVSAWLERPETWGKTLVFAVDIEHADSLYEVFVERGARSFLVHSRTEETVGDVLNQFRACSEPAVLISVGMLNEGVDVPSSRTAFLARPTRSRILMRQMIGRVLRGPAVGGDPIAHIVDVRDRWVDDIEILSPVEIPGVEGTIAPPLPGDQAPLPHVIDELRGEPIPESVLRRLRAQFQEHVRGTPISIGLISTALTGYYELDLVHVPVFEHTADRWRELMHATLRGRPLATRTPVAMFGDIPMPRPTAHEVREMIDYLQAQDVEPPFQEVRTVISVRAIATELDEKPAMTQSERIAWIKKKYDKTLARATFPTFQAFHEAVEQEAIALSGHGPMGTPEDPVRPPPGRKVTQVPSRD